MNTPTTRLPLILTAVAIANFMNIPDTTIVVVSLPAISDSLGATPSQDDWVLTSYAVCLVIMLPLRQATDNTAGYDKELVIAND